MDINLAKRFLKHYADGKTLDRATIGELYLSGYIQIDLSAAGKELLATVITDKGKGLLQGKLLAGSKPGSIWGTLRHDVRGT